MNEKRTVSGRSTSIYLRNDFIDLMDEITNLTGMSRSEIVNAVLESADLNKLLDNAKASS